MKKIIFLSSLIALFLFCSCSAAITDAEQYLRQQVPEIDDYGEYISSQSGGRASLLVESDGTLHDIEHNGVLNQYLMVYVGEVWEEHRVNWDWFYVSENFDNILWYDLPEAQNYSLSEWRESPKYKSRLSFLGDSECLTYDEIVAICKKYIGETDEITGWPYAFHCAENPFPGEDRKITYEGKEFHVVRISIIVDEGSERSHPSYAGHAFVSIDGNEIYDGIKHSDGTYSFERKLNTDPD